MILDKIYDLAFLMINWFIGLFPIGNGFGTEVHTAFSTIGGYVGMFTGILPMDILVYTVGLIFTVEVSIFLFKTTKWIISHIPWVGGKGN